MKGLPTFPDANLISLCLLKNKNKISAQKQWKSYRLLSKDLSKYISSQEVNNIQFPLPTVRENLSIYYYKIHWVVQRLQSAGNHNTLREEECTYFERFWNAKEIMHSTVTETLLHGSKKQFLVTKMMSGNITSFTMQFIKQSSKMSKALLTLRALYWLQSEGNHNIVREECIKWVWFHKFWNTPKCEGNKMNSTVTKTISHDFKKKQFLCNQIVYC